MPSGSAESARSRRAAWAIGAIAAVGLILLLIRFDSPDTQEDVSNHPLVGTWSSFAAEPTAATWTFYPDGTGSTGRGPEDQRSFNWEVTIEGNGLRLFYHGNLFERERHRWSWEITHDRLQLTSRQIQDIVQGFERTSGNSKEPLIHEVANHPIVGRWSVTGFIDVPYAYSWPQTDWTFSPDGTGYRSEPGAETQHFTWAVAREIGDVYLTPLTPPDNGIVTERWIWELDGQELTLASRQERTRIAEGPIRVTRIFERAQQVEP